MCHSTTCIVILNLSVNNQGEAGLYNPWVASEGVGFDQQWTEEAVHSARHMISM